MEISTVLTFGSLAVMIYALSCAMELAGPFWLKIATFVFGLCALVWLGPPTVQQIAGQ